MIKHLLLILFWAGYAVSPAQAGGDACRILVVGDSLSAAFGLSVQDGWVQLLQNRLHQEGSPCRVVNASVSGETTQGGLTRLPSLLQHHSPTLLILELGANNGLRALPVAAMKDDLQAMVQMAQHAGSKVLVLGMQMPPNYGARYTEAFAAAYREVASASGVPLVPFFLDGVMTHPEWLQADGMHPTAEAQSHILGNVWPALSALLLTVT